MAADRVRETFRPATWNNPDDGPLRFWRQQVTLRRPAPWPDDVSCPFYGDAVGAASAENPIAQLRWPAYGEAVAHAACLDRFVATQRANAERQAARRAAEPEDDLADLGAALREALRTQR